MFVIRDPAEATPPRAFLSLLAASSRVVTLSLSQAMGEAPVETLLWLRDSPKADAAEWWRTALVETQSHGHALFHKSRAARISRKSIFGTLLSLDSLSLDLSPPCSPTLQDLFQKLSKSKKTQCVFFCIF